MLGINLATGSPDYGVFATSYEKLTTDVWQNFKEDESNLLLMRTSDRALETTLWLQLLNQIDRTRDLGFDPQASTNRYYGNIESPFDPANTSNDPEIRKQYEESIRANHQKALRDLFEFRLKNLDSSCTTHAINYFISAYAKTPSDAKGLIAVLDTIRDEKHRTELKERLADYVKLLKTGDSY